MLNKSKRQSFNLKLVALQRILKNLIHSQVLLQYHYYFEIIIFVVDLK